MLRSVAWIRFGEPPLAFNIRLKAPAGVVAVGEIVTPTDCVEPDARTTLVVLSFTGSLFTAPPVTDALFRVRVSAKPFTLVRLIVATPFLPWGIDCEKGDAEILKSG
jgi:hypothetical protein